MQARHVTRIRKVAAAVVVAVREIAGEKTDPEKTDPETSRHANPMRSVGTQALWTMTSPHPLATKPHRRIPVVDANHAVIRDARKQRDEKQRDEKQRIARLLAVAVQSVAVPNET